MATTFRLLASMADWSGNATVATPKPEDDQASDEAVAITQNGTATGTDSMAVAAALNLHHDVHIHLPSTSDSAVYVAIFRALKAELLD